MRFRAVLDTNVVLSALMFEEGRLAWLRRAWMARDVVPLVSRATMGELLRVLAYPKFRLSREDREELLGEYLPFAEIVPVAGAVDGVPPCPDADDQMFLELAVAAGASHLVTGDGALLEMASLVSFEIVTPARFRGIVGE